MRIGKRQLEALARLARGGNKDGWNLRGNLLIDLYFPDSFTDDDKYDLWTFNNTKEYNSAKASLARAVKGLIDHGLVEKSRIPCNIGLPDGPYTCLGYRITEAGRKELEHRQKGD